MLRNKIYTGKIVWNKNRYDRKQKTAKGYRYVKNSASEIIESQGQHEAIVTEEVFDKAQALLDRNRRGSFVRQRVWDYPLSGVITCANCGSAYNGVANTKNHRTGEKRRYYRCSGRAHHNIKCGNGDVRSELVEVQVFEILDTLFSAKEINTERLRNLVADQYRSGSTEKVVRELEKLKEELAACQQKQSKLTDAYLEAMISKEIFEKKNRELRNSEGEIRIKIERMELQLIKREESQEYVKRAQIVVKSTKSVHENLDPVTRKEFLKLLFRKLEVRDQAISKFELYEPFHGMYQKVLEERRENAWNPNQTSSNTQSYTSSPSAVR